ncbi:MAG: bifunctional DNA-binding transcriptional regulator/O6-methylguanine-DNA methyltransferase Ada [Telmatospirillum sp.]|nr:bifunctional DNA-binding transcriptional regulator/O6-methylguanine-DNA methyltransferase Ada [Telmatospirillum sp.]
MVSQGSADGTPLTDASGQGAGRSAYVSDDEKWTAVVGRDAGADGLFVYSVRTTGVYCRPSCPSRTAKRDNVRFHSGPEEAGALGFRPCKRCRPDRRLPLSPHGAAIVEACRIIEASEEPPSLESLAAAVGLSRFHFHRLFKEATGVTPKAYAVAHRSRRVREELAAGVPVTEAIYNAGFNSNGRFYAASHELLGMTPTAFRSGGAGELIRFAAGDCSLGSIVVAATAKGLCAILLGDDPDALIHDLEDRFPRAELVGGDPDFDRTVATVVAFVEAPGTGLDLPLDVRGTAFQQRVWKALRAIPAGTTASYSEIAQRIGLPAAARAVARACASNALAVAIPCHRVVRHDGGLSGYRWGVERKRTLLEREAGSGVKAPSGDGHPAASPRVR